MNTVNAEVDEVHVGYKTAEEATRVLKASMYPDSYKVVQIVYKCFGGEILGFVLQKKRERD